MRYLVTGGAGFIGSHLVDALLDSGYEVVVLDNLSTGNFSNISRHRNKKNFLFHEGDILDYSLVSSLVHSCDRVLHFAAAVGVLNILTDPIGSMKVNVLGTENVLDACRSSKKPILIASSSEIYGKNKAQTGRGRVFQTY